MLTTSLKRTVVVARSISLEHPHGLTTHLAGQNLSQTGPKTCRTNQTGIPEQMLNHPRKFQSFGTSNRRPNRWFTNGQHPSSTHSSRLVEKIPDRGCPSMSRRGSSRRDSRKDDRTWPNRMSRTTAHDSATHHKRTRPITKMSIRQPLTCGFPRRQ